MKKIFRLHQHPFALLEVLIAFALVALCALPLIYPHIFILQSERKFISTVELDHSVNLLYADFLQKLYKNEIPWQNIESGHSFPIDPHWFKPLGIKEDLPFIGNYKFEKIQHKPPSKDSERVAYIFNLKFSFRVKPGYFFEKDLKENTPTITYNYHVTVEHIKK
jgi:hypothetical protein